MAEKRKYMMPVANGRYHLTIYFKDPNEICNTQHRGDRKGGKKFLIQTGASWKSTMNIPISETELESTLWVEGNAVPFMGKGDRISSTHSLSSPQCTSSYCSKSEVLGDLVSLK